MNHRQHVKMQKVDINRGLYLFILFFPNIHIYIGRQLRPGSILQNNFINVPIRYCELRSMYFHL